MTASLPDEEARRAAARALDRSFSVEAGAGTGKTSLIVERVVNLLADGHVTVPRLAVITFGEAAAAELEERIRSGLADRLSKEREGFTQEPRSGDERASTVRRLERAREELDRAAIQTIHSFAAALLRLRPIDAGVDPRFSVASPERQRVLREEAFAEYLAAEANPGSHRLREILRAGVSTASLRELAMRFVDNRDALGREGSRPGAGLPPAPPDPILFAGKLREWIRECVRFTRIHCPTENDTLRTGFERAARELEDLERLPPQSVQSFLLQRKPSPTIGRSLGAKEHWDTPEALSRARKMAEAWPEEFSAFRRALGARVADVSEQWLRGFLETYDRRKGKEGVLDFQDLLLKARDLLVQPEAASDLRKAYRAVLVDEFQDTDPLQVEIVALLTGRGTGTAWESRKPDPGAVFIVGDPKQSIYRFRRADSAIYRAAREWLERTSASPPRLTVTTNFRSRPGIIHWVNAVFSRLLDEYVPIDSYRSPVDGAGVVYLLPENIMGEGGEPDTLVRARATDLRLREARMIARAIAEKIDAGDWSVEGGLSGARRSARLGDVAILFSAMTDVGLYEDALREAGIRCRTTGGRRYFARREVAWFVSLLRAVENPHDEVAVIAALRSPYFGFTDAEILLARLARGRLDPLQQEGPRDELGAALMLLGTWHQSRNGTPPGVFVRRLLDESGALVLAELRTSRGRADAVAPDDQTAMNLAKLGALARRHEGDGGTFRSFVRWLVRAAEEEFEETEGPSIPAEDDSVRLMTIHKAKGLEFPIVLLADLARQSTRKEDFVVDRAMRRVEFRLSGPGGVRLSSSGFSAAWEEEEKELTRERRRLLYVAATRARDLLVLPLPATDAKGGFIQDLATAGVLPGEGGGLSREVQQWVQVIRVDAEPSGVRALVGLADGLERAGSASSEFGDPESWLQKRRALIEAASSGTSFLAASQSSISAPRVAVLSDSRDPEGRWEPGARPWAREIGIAVHAVLENADLANPAALPPLARAAAAAAGIENQSAQVEVLAARALSQPVIGRARVRRFLREVPVVAMEGSVLLEGQIDLVYEEDDGSLVVVDFKTDPLEREDQAPRRAETYRAQLALYARALERATGRPVRETVLLFLALGLEVRFPNDADARGLAAAAIERAAR